MLQTYLTVALVAYLLGSIPFGYILVRLFLKQDIRHMGSGNIGATNVARSGRKGLAIATLLLDAAKGFMAVLLVGRFAARYPRLFDAILLREFGNEIPDMDQVHFWLGYAALFAIVGHCFPIWLQFKGGKGVATAIGAFALLEPGAAGLAFLIFAVLFALTRLVSLSSIVAAACFPVLSLLIALRSNLHQKTLGPMLVVIILSSLIVILKHHSNIRRLLNGTEPKFGAPKQAIPADPVQAEKNA